MAKKNQEKTVGSLIRFLCDDEFRNLSVWPPNVFAVTSMILGESGAYRYIIDPPTGKVWPPGAPEEWCDEAARVGTKWRRCFVNNIPIPQEVSEDITFLEKHYDTPLSDIHSFDSEMVALRNSVFRLHVFADQASEGLGIPGGLGDISNLDDSFFITGLLKLLHTSSLSDIHTSRARVLPKLRTPQVGISLRSLSHHLAFDRSEVNVEWVWAPSNPALRDIKRLNLLIIPWPLKVDASSFISSSWPLLNMDSEKFGFFEYCPTEAFDFLAVKALIESAQAKSSLDGVVLPECALHESEIERFEEMLKVLNISFFVAGVRGEKKNYAHMGFKFEKYERHIQHKHHRWLLDDSQIQNYNLNSSIALGKKYWEAIEIRERSIKFICFNEWLTLCHLICEDLARHDPVTQVVRSVGPNLLIALLLDGPQLSVRWPGRYASVLADDPGSSVLTVTSLGMSVRSRPTGLPPKRVIALWKDSKGGPKEVCLDSGESAAILTFSANLQTEVSADGRVETGASSLELTGVEYV